MAKGDVRYDVEDVDERSAKDSTLGFVPSQNNSEVAMSMMMSVRRACVEITTREEDVRRSIQRGSASGVAPSL